MIGEKPKLINIELTEMDAEQFVQYRKYQNRFLTLLDKGVFEVRNGSATLNFDNKGEIRAIEIRQLVYKV